MDMLCIWKRPRLPSCERVLFGDAMSDPTKEQVQALWVHMSAKYGSVIVPKSSSEFMQVVSQLLGKMHISDPDNFMLYYTTTIANCVYVPFEIGVDNGIWSLWDQIGVCAHEHHHIEQQERIGPATFDWRYLTDADSRARFEAEAYICQVELDFWRKGTLDYRPEDLSIELRGYGCNDDQVAIASDVLRLLGKTVLAGGVLNKSSRDVINWMNQFAPEVREV